VPNFQIPSEPERQLRDYWWKTNVPSPAWWNALTNRETQIGPASPNVYTQRLRPQIPAWASVPMSENYGGVLADKFLRAQAAFNAPQPGVVGWQQRGFPFPVVTDDSNRELMRDVAWGWYNATNNDPLMYELLKNEPVKAHSGQPLTEYSGWPFVR